MKIYVKKYCLSSGIQEMESPCDREDGYASVKGLYGLLRKGEWHTTMEAAKRNAYARRLAKIKSVEKQLAKLQAMKFE